MTNQVTIQRVLSPSNYYLMNGWDFDLLLYVVCYNNVVDVRINITRPDDPRLILLVYYILETYAPLIQMPQHHMTLPLLYGFYMMFAWVSQLSTTNLVPVRLYPITRRRRVEIGKRPAIKFVHTYRESGVVSGGDLSTFPLTCPPPPRPLKEKKRGGGVQIYSM